MTRRNLTRGTTRAASVALLAGLCAAGTAQANSVSYLLDRSSILPDGVPYLKVTVADGAAGAIDFTVQALPALLSYAGRNFSLEQFAFDVTGGGHAEARNVSELPTKWRARNGGRMQKFGLFDIRVTGPEHGSASTLHFSVTGITFDQLLDYVELSHGRAPEGHSFFAAQVDGLDLGERREKTGWFGGNTVAVPVPAGLLLLGSALSLLTSRRPR